MRAALDLAQGGVDHLVVPSEPLRMAQDRAEIETFPVVFPSVATGPGKPNRAPPGPAFPGRVRRQARPLCGPTDKTGPGLYADCRMVCDGNGGFTWR